ncbi:hypothetical protein CHS0354_029778 [Potamilus streckersoni]|uniref:RNA polymerase II subunit A C-terminal domain phosphatase n=1 Tax=Potamilus streckersoni TaxID=2493646 RepID=A0AAE0TH53_9BIVA|nr:hypothetical protein CHS0354_029778 [Potamilus streckersoni]
MASTMEKITLPVTKIAKITKWKVKKGQNISKGTILCFYETDDEKNQKLKSNLIAKVNEIHANLQDPILPGQDILTLEPIACSHPTVMKDMCADCGEDLRRENGMAGDRKEEVKASVAMVHCIPELIVSEEMAQELGKADEENLLRTRKLVLLVDLDQTLVHTTNDNIPPNLKDVYHFQLWHGRQLLWYHTRLRPRTKEFLEKISKLYELHICTFGVRLYAHTIARFLDPEEKYFSHRILSRDECFDATSKIANLKALFPCGDSMVCIIDDREDVWNFSPNLVHVKPYRFFQGTADINAPEGLTKTENDDKPVVHMVRRISHSSTDLKEGSGEDIVSLEQGKNVKSSDDKENRSSDGNREPASSSVEEKEITDDSKSDEVKNNSTDDYKGKYSTKERKTINSSDDNDVFVTDSLGDPRKGKSEEESDKSEDKEMKHDCGSQSKKGEKNADIKKGIKKNETDSTELIEWDDDDDYLFYLEEILTRIHKAFYDFHDQLKTKSASQEKPNLKYIIPYVRKKTLKNCNIVFSGVIPTNMPAEKSRAYNVAKTLGASIQSSLVTRKSATDKEATTHLIAAKLGTNKIKLANKFKDIYIVTPDWLWNCYERWEHVEEALFPLSKNYCSVAYCDSPNLSKVDKTDANSDNNQTKRKSEEMEDVTSALNECSKRGRQEGGKAESDMETPSSMKIQSSTVQPSTSDSSKSSVLEEHRPSHSQTETKFSFTYNPLYAFSDDDLECMDKEVEDIMEEGDDDSSSEDEEERDSRIRNQVLSQSSSGLDTEEESTRDSLTADFPRGWSVKDHKSIPRKASSDDDKRSKSPDEDDEEESETELEKYEKTMEAFAPDSEGDSDEYQDSIGSVDEEIAEAVEKELMRD